MLTKPRQGRQSPPAHRAGDNSRPAPMASWSVILPAATICRPCRGWGRGFSPDHPCFTAWAIVSPPRPRLRPTAVGTGGGDRRDARVAAASGRTRRRGPGLDANRAVHPRPNASHHLPGQR
jgi:hypothetical protein